jgi:hypothetical protein
MIFNGCEQLPYPVRAGFALLLVALPVCWLLRRERYAFLESLASRFSLFIRHRAATITLVMLMALVGHCAVYISRGAPEPRIHDEFSYLLGANTFVHGRLANPPHAHWQFFETMHVNQQPKYVSKYPPAQSLFLAAGQLIARKYYWGVVLSSVLFCGALVWALQAYVSPGWAVIGGVIAVLRFSLSSYWGNSYWGGFVAAIGGALLLGVAGRLPKCAEITRRQRIGLSVLFGVGLLLLANSRPYEGFVLAAVVLAYGGWQVRKMPLETAERWRSLVLPTTVVIFAGAMWMGFYFYKTTGSPLKMPYQVNDQTYAKAPAFVFEREYPWNPVYRHARLQRFYAGWAYYTYLYERTGEGFKAGLQKHMYDLWIFFLGPILTIPFLIGLAMAVRDRRRLLPLICVLAMLAGVAVETWTHPHYFAPATAAVCILVMAGLQSLWESRRNAGQALAIAVVVTATILGGIRTSMASERADICLADFGEVKPVFEGRGGVIALLHQFPGKHLVFERGVTSVHVEYVYNTADIDSQEIVWAGDMGRDKDAELIAYYPDRQVWVLDLQQRALIPFREYNFAQPRGVTPIRHTR